MPTPATAIFRQIKYKQETTYGEIPTLTGSTAIRRVEFSPTLEKDTYQSSEIRTDQQIADFRHGARRAVGTLRGELSPKAYADFFAALLRRDFAATTAMSGLSITIGGTAGAWTVTRSAGSFITDGLKVGDVIRLSGGTLNANNANKNLLVYGLTATVATCIVLNGTSLTAEGPIASVTVSVPGKRTYVPTSGHTDRSFTIESWFADLVQSEMYTGMKPGRASLSLPATGMATVDIEFAGQNVQTFTTEQFTSPNAAPTFGVTAAVNGVLLLGSTQMTAVRDLSIEINGNLGGAPVVGSNVIPNQFPGRVEVTGQFSAYFDDVTQRDAFLNETEQSMVVVLTTDNSAAADFISITLPRIKIGGAAKNDAADGIVQTIPFQALLNGSGGTGTSSERTTIVMQDSQA